MELRDLIVTPLLLIIICLVAIRIRPFVTDEVTQRYFFPALAAKIAGALALGFIYQFYYDGGDTFNFHTHGSRHIWDAFMDSPITGFKLLFGGKEETGIYEYSSRILFFRDKSSYFVIRIAAFLDLLTFSSYSATAVLFSVISFCGAWAFFSTFYRKYPELAFVLAVCTLFIPSVIFWGSGILKDTLVVAALGLATYCCNKIFIERNFRIAPIILLIVCLYVILKVKLFLLQAFIPAAMLWIFYEKLILVKSQALRYLLFPLVAFVTAVSCYWIIMRIGESDARYSSFSQIARTAKVTAYDIGFYTGKDAGSGYSLGELDGTFANMFTKAPQAINVTLFRPYLWEVKNPLMVLSSLEGVAMFLFVLYIILTARSKIFLALNNTDVIFALVFSITVAFAVGITSYNFGTLARYKIPLLPYFTVALVLIKYNVSRSVIRNQ